MATTLNDVLIFAVELLEDVNEDVVNCVRTMVKAIENVTGEDVYQLNWRTLASSLGIHFLLAATFGFRFIFCATACTDPFL